MNWTGGRLSRHSGASNTVKDRQKQHFAKVQQALRRGPKKHSPIKWTFFDHAVEDHDRRKRETSFAQQRAPHVYNGQQNQSHWQQYGHLSSIRNLAPQNSSGHSTRSRNPSQDRPLKAPVPQQPARVPTGDLYTATPPPQNLKRERQDSVAFLETDNMAEQEEGETISEKRRKILRKGDWVGVSIQRPLQLAFASPRKEENIGRRRKVSDGHRARYSSKHLHIASPFPTKTRLLPHQASSQATRQERTAARTDVKISIGGRVVPPGISSSSAHRRLGSHSTIQHRRSQTILSDVMLLDTSLAQEKLQISVGDPVATRFSTYGHQIDLPDQDFCPMHTSPAPDAEQHEHMPNEAEYKGDGWANVYSRDVSELPENGPDSASHRDNFKSTSQSYNTPASEAYVKQDTQAGRLIFSSSTGSMHHPAPRSSRVSVLLRSASSDIAESTIAQVGKNRPFVTSSQVLENEIWKMWAAQEQAYDHFSDSSGCNERSKAQREIISPGISVNQAPWTSRSEWEAEGGMEDDRSHELQARESEAVTTRSDQSDIVISENSDGPESSIPETTLVVAQEVEDIANEDGQKTSLADKEFPNAISPILPHNPIIEEDQNESWTKFLFGGIGDESETSVPILEQNVAPSQKGYVFGTSILGQASNTGFPLPYSTSDFESEETPAGDSSKYGQVSVSPCTSGSRYRGTQLELASTGQSSVGKGGISVRAEQGSVFPSNSDYFSTSDAVHPTSSDSTSDRVEIAGGKNPQRKVTFTRPKPFIGGKKNMTNAQQCDSLHIGRGLREDDESYDSGRKRAQPVHSFLELDERDERNEQEVVESIEDD